MNFPNVPASFTPAQTAALIGIPSSASHTAVTVYNTSLRLTDGNGAFVDKAVTVQIVPLDFAGNVPKGLGVGDSPSIQFLPIDGTPPYFFSVSAGTQPTGLNMNVTTGTLSGTVTAQGTFNFTVKVQDSSSTPMTATHDFTMTISPLRITIVTNPILPSGTINVPYNFQITATGGTPPYTFGIGTGFSLPAGMTLSASGMLSGTPTNSNYSLETQITLADNASNTTAIRVAINILPTAPTALGLTTASLSDVTTGDNMLVGVAASGGVPPYTFDVAPGSNLPPGAFILTGYQVSPDEAPDHGLIRARIHTPGNYSFVLRVTDSAGSQATRPYTLHVSPIGFWYSSLPPTNGATPVLGTAYSAAMIAIGGAPPYTVTPVNIPAGLSVDNTGFVTGTPQESGTGIPLYLALADSASNTYNSSGTMAISSTSATALFCSGGDLGTAQLGNEYSSNIVCTGSPQNPPVFTASLISGSLPPGLVLLSGNGLNNGENVNVAAQVAGVPSQTGNYTAVVKVTDGMGDVGQREIKLHVSGLAIVNTGISSGSMGVPYNQTFDVRGGTPPYSFTTTGSLPTGLNIDPALGTISGTPTTTGAYGVGVQVTDSAGDHFTRNYTLNIYQVIIGNANVLPFATYGQPYSYTFAATPAASYQWTTTSNLPNGLTLNASTGVLSGTPTQTGTFILVINATNGAVSANKNFTLFITSQTLQPVLTGLPEVPLADVVVGQQVRQVLNVTGGTPPYTVSLPSGAALPPGLSLVPDNQVTGTTGFGRYSIAGIPLLMGNYNFVVRYTDSAGISENRLLSMNVTSVGLATLSPPIGFAGTPYSAQLYGTGGNGTFAFALAPLHNNVMPPGLTLATNGAVSGTPTSTGAYDVTIQITSGAAVRNAVVTFNIDANSLYQRVDFDFGPVLDDVTAGKNREVLITPTLNTYVGNLTWSVVGSLPAGMQLYQGASLPPNYPGGAAVPQAVISGAPSTPGTYIIGIQATDSTGNFGIRYATLVVSPLAVGPLNDSYTLGMVVPPAQVGVPYSFALSLVSGQAPFTVSFDSGTYLPSGMNMTVPGLLTGTPSDPGNFVFYGITTDALGRSRRFTLGLTVYPAAAAIGLNTLQYSYLTSAVANTQYSFALNNLVMPNYGTGPFTWSLNAGSTLPPGLGIVSGALSGVPTVAGSYVFSLVAMDAAGRQSLAHNTVLVVSPLTVGPASLVLGTIGTPYSQQLSTSGGTAPYTYQLVYDSALPPGLTLSPGGLLSGTPSLVTGPFAVRVLVTDAANNAVPVFYGVNIGTNAPSPGAVTLPGATQAFTFTFSDPSGWQNLGVVNVLINNFLDGRSACYLAFQATSAGAGTLYLVDDAGDAGGPFATLSLPSSGTIQNSQCTVSGVGSSVSAGGNTLTLTLAITFSASFSGNKVVYVAARDMAQGNSGWQALNTFGVPGSLPAGPQVIGVSPARSVGSGGLTYVFTFNDTNGVSDLGVVNMLINNFLDGRYACYLAYSRPLNVLYLMNDPGTALLPGITLGGSGSLGNSQCVVNSAGSSAVASGNALTLTLNMSFPSSFAGNRVIYMAARSNGDVLNSGWQAVGSRTVQ
jgi:hypothetical protein